MAAEYGQLKCLSLLLEHSSVVDLTSMLDNVSGDVCNECSSNKIDCIHDRIFKQIYLYFKYRY